MIRRTQPTTFPDAFGDEYGVDGVLIVLIALSLSQLQCRILELMLNAVHLISQRVCGIQ